MHKNRICANLRKWAIFDKHPFYHYISCCIGYILVTFLLTQFFYLSLWNWKMYCETLGWCWRKLGNKFPKEKSILRRKIPIYIQCDKEISFVWSKKRSLEKSVAGNKVTGKSYNFHRAKKKKKSKLIHGAQLKLSFMSSQLGCRICRLSLSREVRLLSSTEDTILHWWWSSSPGALGNAEYPFIAITPRSFLIRIGSAISGSNKKNHLLWIIIIIIIIIIISYLKPFSCVQIIYIT